MHRFGLLLTLFLLAPALPADAASRCFAETNQCVEGRFLVYWEENGGLPVFGYPISTRSDEISHDTGRTYLTQWFERNRFELHPENAAPYDILLGRLGVDALIELGLDWSTFPKASPSTAHFFPATGHAIAPEFWPFWREHGLELGDRGVSEREALALFGYPVSELRMETNASGDTVLTQWFERARFEYHPDNPEPHKVLLGLLGNEVRRADHAGDGGESSDQIGDIVSQGIVLYNKDDVMRLTDDATDQNNWQDMVEVKQKFTQPGELFAFHIYGPDDVNKLPPDPEGQLEYDPRINYPGGRGVGRQVRRLYNGVWEWHFTLPQMTAGEAYIPQYNRGLILNLMRFMLDKNNPSNYIPEEMDRYIKELAADPYANGSYDFPLELEIKH